MKYIMFFGSIGVGKTTIGNYIKSQISEVDFVEENLENNVYLKQFYKDMKTYAFRSTLEMLLLMKNNYDLVDQTKQIAILDNGVEELICYNKYLVSENILSKEEFDMYHQFYDLILHSLPKTDLYVYFTCNIDEQLKRIRTRNRSFEQEIDQSFLEKLNKEYESFIKKLPKEKLWIIDTSEGFSLEKFRYEFEKKLLSL